MVNAAFSLSALRWILPAVLVGVSNLAAAVSPLPAPLPAPEPFSCPQALGQTDQKALVDHPGWTAVSIRPETTRHELRSFQINWGPVQVSDGAIYDQQVEKPEGAKGGGTLTLTWNVRDIQKGFAICGYAFANVQLVRPLEGYSTCTAVSRRSSKDADYRLESAGCR